MMAAAIAAAIRTGHRETQSIAEESLRRELDDRRHPEVAAALLLLLGARTTAGRTVVSPESTASSVAQDFVERIDVELPRRRALGRALQGVSSRVDTIASTEAVQVFNSARSETIASLGDVAFEYGTELWKTWEAIVDGRECRVCFGRDGESIRAWQAFPGDQPGFVHPRCRCFASFEVRVIAERIAA